MLSCKDVSRKLSEAQDRKLSFGERMAVKIHLMMCDACRTMDRQFKALAKIARQFASTDDATPDGTESKLSEEATARIRSRLEESDKGS